MTARHEVNLTIQVRAFTIADSDQSAIDETFNSIENLIKGNGHQKLLPEIDIDEVEMEEGDATAI